MVADPVDKKLSKPFSVRFPVEIRYYLFCRLLIEF